MAKYIIIDENFTFYKCNEITADMKKDCDNGFIYIFGISNPNKPSEYYNNKWTELEEYKE